MVAKVAVAVIHGIASEEQKRPPISSTLSFSKGLHKKLRRYLGKDVLATDIAWREIFWADILSHRQERYLSIINRLTSFDRIRRFLVKGIADAAAIQPREGTDDNAYDLVQDRVRDTLVELDRDTQDNAPLIVLAHSFGGWIMSNYIWDLSQGRFEGPNEFQNLKTMSRFVTFGSNIPLFTFAYPPEKLEPIRCPAPDNVINPWWLNYYDRHDVLSFPIGPIGQKYEAMVERGELQDIQINSGGLFTSWNPLSHERYWTDKDFASPLANIVKQTLESF